MKVLWLWNAVFQNYSLLVQSSIKYQVHRKWVCDFTVIQPDISEAPSPLKKKGCCSTRGENMLHWYILKESVFMMLIYEKKKKKVEDSVTDTFFYHSFRWQCYNSEMYNLQRFSFLKKLLCVSLKRNGFIYFIFLVFLYCQWCTCHCFVCFIFYFLFFFCMTSKKFYFQYCFCNFVVSNLEKNQERK